MTEDGHFIPIPPAIRIALRNAVGGWGPYTVGGIIDLFEGHGFSDRGEAADHVRGDRRTAADEFQAAIDWGAPDQHRRYLALVADVLTHYPDGDAEGEGPKLRSALERAGVQIRSADTSTPSATVEQGGATMAADVGDHLWAPNRIRVFVSHISAHKVEVKELADALDGSGFSCFVAHVDIAPSRAWQQTIETALNTCDVLVAYVTPGFKDSDWTDQEVGWALGRGVLIIPIKAGAIPYGFFGSYQAVPAPVRFSADALAFAVTRAICDATYSRQRSHAATLDPLLAQTLVEGFCRSWSFNTTRERFELLTRIPTADWTPALVTQIREAANTNTQIHHANIQDGTGSSMAGPAAIEELLRAKRSAGIAL